MKKLIPDENSKNRWSKFFNGKGFYVVLAVCIVVVAATAVLVTTHNVNDNGTSVNDKLVPGDANADKSDKSEPASASAAKSSSVTDKNVAENTSGTQAKASGKTDVNTVANAAKKLLYPVNGIISKAYSAAPVWNSTTKDYRAHEGIDFKVAKGASVVAVADGVIVDVSSEKINSATNETAPVIVKIKHDQYNLVSVYRCLLPTGISDISAGMKVKAGQEIGKVGDPQMIETADASTFEFGLLQNNKPIDPTPNFVDTKVATK